MDLGQKIRTLRKQRGMTIQQVADIVGVNKGTVGKWERGEVDNMQRKNIPPLAKALGVSIPYLMDWYDDSPPENRLDAGFVSDLLLDITLQEHVKKLMKLSSGHKQTIYDNIEFWYEKEGL